MSTHRWPEYARAWPEVLAGLREEMTVWLMCNPLSMKALAKRVGVDRRTLARWLAGEENLAVSTVTSIATWLQAEPLCPTRDGRHDGTRNGCATLESESPSRKRTG